jgi:glutaredoxin
MSNEDKKVTFYGLSTCGWCRRTKQWLDDLARDVPSNR